ncbi:hypothetical protein FCV25MIE_29328 [Fagus crenata]
MDKVPLEQLESLRALAHIVAAGKFEVLQGTTSKSLGVVEDVITFSRQYALGKAINREKALYVTAFVGELCLKRELIDTGACTNVIPVSTLKAMG